MKQSMRTMTVAATALVAIASFALTIQSASAEDICRTDVTSGVRGCGFASLEQCQAMSSGRGGTCAPNPFPAQASTSSAYAFHPAPKHLKSTAHKK